MYLGDGGGKAQLGGVSKLKTDPAKRRKTQGSSYDYTHTQNQESLLISLEECNIL